MASVDASSCQISERSNKLYYWLYYFVFGPFIIIRKIRSRLTGADDLDDLAKCFCNCCESAADSATGRTRYRMSRGCCPCCCSCLCS
ncbi:MAG: hypothetical protein ACTSO7_11330 [Candidatus Heimdallarchaeota archaeon]